MADTHTHTSGGEDCVMATRACMAIVATDLVDAVSAALRAEAERTPMDDTMAQSRAAGIRLAVYESLRAVLDAPALAPVMESRIRYGRFLTDAQPRPTAYADRINALRALNSRDEAERREASAFLRANPVG